MRIERTLLGIAVLATGCGRPPDQAQVATAARSWAESAALAESLWHDGAVPTAFAEHTLERATDALATARGDARQLADTGHGGDLTRAIDSTRRLLPRLDSSIAHSRRDSAATLATQLHAIGTTLAPLATDGAAR